MRSLLCCTLLAALAVGGVTGFTAPRRGTLSSVVVRMAKGSDSDGGFSKKKRVRKSAPVDIGYGATGMRRQETNSLPPQLEAQNEEAVKRLLRARSSSQAREVENLIEDDMDLLQDALPEGPDDALSRKAKNDQVPAQTRVLNAISAVADAPPVDNNPSSQFDLFERGLGALVKTSTYFVGGVLILWEFYINSPFFTRAGSNELLDAAGQTISAVSQSF